MDLTTRSIGLGLRSSKSNYRALKDSEAMANGRFLNSEAGVNNPDEIPGGALSKFGLRSKTFEELIRCDRLSQTLISQWYSPMSYYPRGC